MCPLCLVCGDTVAVRGRLCPDCEADGRQAENIAWFDTGIGAIAYGESRADWPHFRVRHVKDHVFIVFKMEAP